ncbi:MAG: phosphoenolpyruvate--protein phosphotransferase [Simkaniaceae bacterium]|nr:phosphoenolpyruvate--protein phosphotransferase [Simkaniaceae bacterium]
MTTSPEESRESFRQDITYTGCTVSEGIVSGTLVFIDPDSSDPVPDVAVPREEVDREIFRYREALKASRADLHRLRTLLHTQQSTEAAGIIDTQIRMLDDAFMTTRMEKKIRKTMKSTESVFRHVMHDYGRKMSCLSGHPVKERLVDIEDITDRILEHLRSPPLPTRLIAMNKGEAKRTVICLKRATPSLMTEVISSGIRGLITEHGGRTSHAALIARSQKLGYVAGINPEELRQFAGRETIVDGRRGTVIINPSPATVAAYATRQKERMQTERKRNHEREEGSTETRDGRKIDLLANIDRMEDVILVERYGAQGIGLFRSELLLHNGTISSFSEEEQYPPYARIMEIVRDKPVTFRLFDIGEGKGRIRACPSETESVLGCRAIRFLLRNETILRAQLRALMRAGKGGNIRILLPLVSDVTEVRAVKLLIEEIGYALRKEGHTVAGVIPLGAMIETPSAALISDLIAKECDFLSIGTNDLMQYTLAMDRCHRHTYPFYHPFHPSMIRSVRHIVMASRKAATPLSLCGEMATDPTMLPFLIGMGIDTLSCPPRHIPDIRRILGTLDANNCQRDVEEVLTHATCAETERFLRFRHPAC